MDFDPYLEWLKIPAQRRPPTYYDLLGLAQAESDASRIYRAAMDRMAIVRRYHLGERASDALRLQNEISLALDCLRDPNQKRRYDERFLSETIDDRIDSTADAPAANTTLADTDPQPLRSTAPSGDQASKEASTAGVRLAAKAAPTVPEPTTGAVWPWLALSTIGVGSVAGLMVMLAFGSNRKQPADDKIEVVASANEDSTLGEDETDGKSLDLDRPTNEIDKAVAHEYFVSLALNETQQYLLAVWDYKHSEFPRSAVPEFASEQGLDAARFARWLTYVEERTHPAIAPVTTIDDRATAESWVGQLHRDLASVAAQQSVSEGNSFAEEWADVLLALRADDPRLVVGTDGQVTTWPNRAGVADAAVGANQAAPCLTTATIGGWTRPVLRFEGRETLQFPGTVPVVGSLLVVFRADANAESQRLVGWEDSSVGRHGLGVSPDATGGVQGFLRRDGASGDVAVPALPTPEFQLLTITWGPGGVEAYRDGLLVVTNSTIQAVSSDPQITTLRVGGPGSGGAPQFRGELAELRVYAVPLDAAKRKQIEAELRQRWFEAGLLAEVPFDPIADLYQELLSPRGPCRVDPADRAELSAADARPTDASSGSELGSSAEERTRGKPLNFDFESGTLADWTAEGDAFVGQPVEGDTVAVRRPDMQSQHAGRFWIGTFERARDQPQGTLTSVPFRVTHPFASFLVAGGPYQETCVQIVLKDSGKAIYQVSGDSTENLKPMTIDLREHLGAEIFIRLVDRQSGPWGHINFDDFRFHEAEPSAARVGPVPSQTPSTAWDAHDGSSVQPSGNWIKTPNELVAGDRVLVEQLGLWWRGQVKSVAADGSVAIHYVGWASSWDESVPVSRLQVP